MKNIFIGIDFSKEKFDATVIKAEGVEERGERAFNEFKATTSGFRSFVKWVKSNSDDLPCDAWLFCGENTGDYSKPLCNFLYGEGYDMWLENAKCIKDSAPLRRLKTDRADSAMIAEYAMRNYDKAVMYKPLSPSLSQLREIFLYRHSLVRHKCALMVRRGEKKDFMEKSQTKTMISQSSKHLIREFEKVIDKCDKKIKDLIASDEELKATYEIVTSMPGIGPLNATCLMIYTDNFKKFNYDSRKIACYYGVAPFGRDSGSSVHTDPHVHYMANRVIKALLTQAALASINYCRPMAVYYHRLIVKGKKPMVAQNNVKNKMLHIITAMVKNGTKYDPEHEYLIESNRILDQVC